LNVSNKVFQNNVKLNTKLLQNHVKFIVLNIICNYFQNNIKLNT